MVSIVDIKRRLLPHEWRSHPVFLLEKVPTYRWRSGEEPRAAKIVPCTLDGRRLRGARAVAVGLSWLDPDFEIEEDVGAHDRQRAVCNLLMHRLQETPSVVEVPDPTLFLSDSIKTVLRAGRV